MLSIDLTLLARGIYACAPGVGGDALVKVPGAFRDQCPCASKQQLNKL